MAIDFPDFPEINDIFTVDNRSWRWTGAVWEAETFFGITGATGPTGPAGLGIVGVTASAEELNILDGATAITSEINHLVGVTSNVQTQLNGKLGGVNAQVSQADTSATVVRNITASTSPPSGGVDGQIWVQYS
jgi:hypothetical protein